jgi:hypothetical protein
MGSPKMENPFLNLRAKADKLYKTEYEYVRNEKDCRLCYKTKLIKQDKQKTDMLRIHYRTIAFGN